MENSKIVLPKPLPLGFIYKRYSWRAEGNFFHIIQKVHSEKMSIYYDEVFMGNDAYKSFTNISHERMMFEFRRGTYSLLTESEQQNFKNNYPFTIKKLKDRGIEKLIINPN